MKRYTLKDLAYTTFTGEETFVRHEDVKQLAAECLYPTENLLLIAAPSEKQRLRDLRDKLKALVGTP